VCDIFSGSLAVSLALKRSGFRVAANDINLFSAVLGRALLLEHHLPAVPLEGVLTAQVRSRYLSLAEREMAVYRGRAGYGYVDGRDHRDAAQRLLALILYLQDSPASRGLRNRFVRSDFFDHYCEEGQRSAFTSARGRTGRRRFFSSDNARHIDAILNQLRQWHAEKQLTEHAEAMLLSVLMGAVERVSNTQGTYHDFPRTSYAPRALRPLRLQLPALDGLLDLPSRKHVLGEEEDSLEFIARVPEHLVLYIDPPYNFRQYTAYYFLPNVLCRYPTLDDPEAYFREVTYVRGQNPADDFVSTFCKPARFIDSLRLLIERAEAETVVLSYFDGRNHWNDFKSDSNGEGFRRLNAFFQEPLFQKRSAKVEPVKRLNYQSYGGYKARNVDEYLFIAKKS
jgi:adenine-specific DNA methylase